MSATRFEEILDQLDAAFRSGTPLAGGRIYEAGDIAAVPDGVDFALLFGIINAQAVGRFAGADSPLDWEITIKVSAFSRNAKKLGSLGRGQFQLANDAHARIMSSALKYEIQPSRVTPDHEVAQWQMGSVDLFYSVTLETQNGTLEAL
jgi:hypothetical protein